jgi:hypothetical protein
MKKVALFLLLCIVAIATGCPKSTPVRPAVINRVANYEIAKFDKNMANYECAVNGTTFDPEDLTYKNCGTNAKDPTKALQIRNDVIYQLIRATDYNYFQFENDLYVKRATGSILADIIDTSANFAATITNGERAKTIINAAIISFRGGRKSVSLNYFREQTGEILITKMQTSRNRVLKEILTQLKDKDINDYPLDAALGDTIRYFYAGTLPRALQELQQDTSVAAKEANDDILILKDVKPSLLATEPQKVNAVNSFDTLNKLAGDAQNAASDSERLKVMSKLLKIVEELNKETSVISEINKETALKPILEDINKQKTDGLALARRLLDLRFEARDRLSFTMLTKINDIIIRFGSETKGEK